MIVVKKSKPASFLSVILDHACNIKTSKKDEALRNPKLKAKAT